jgi:phosphate transport system permease protein
VTATTTDLAPHEEPSGGSLTSSSISLGRRYRNQAATILIWLAVLVAAVPLGFILYYVILKGAHLMSLAFLTKPIPLFRERGPGMGPAVAGTIVITAGATIMAVPLGILAAVYVTEYGAGNRLSGFIRFMSDVMAGVPSIVMGLFIFTVFTLRFHHFTGFGGSLALACLMLPIVIRATDSMLVLVPRDLREASYALGTSKSRTILTVVLPAAIPGITSGCLLAVARAAGETAPLLFTIGLIESKANFNLFKGSNTTLSAQIFRLAQQPFPASQQRAWTAALTLIIMVLILTVSARVVASRFTVKPT